MLRLATFNGLFFALKGRDNSAQGTALGTTRELKNHLRNGDATPVPDCRKEEALGVDPGTQGVALG